MNQSHNRLVIFARAPMAGTVKRRLAADIGAARARHFYAAVMERTVRRLACDSRWQTVVAVTPDRFATHGRFWPRGIARVRQGQGDLGRRMARALAAPLGVRTVLVGTDIPGIRPRHIARAFAALDRFDVVFGPATDGGYWLVGVRSMGRAPHLFDDVHWSSELALADTLANVKVPLTIALVDRLSDVDDGAAYARWSGN